MKKVWLVSAVLVLALAATASADAITAVTFTGVNHNGYDDGGNGANHMAGYSFTPTQDLQLTALGYYQFQGQDVWGNWRPTNAADHMVGIFTGSWNGVSNYTGGGTLLTSATVTPTSSAMDASGYSWVTLSAPVTLYANTTYTLVGQVFTKGGTLGDMSFATDVTGLSVDSNISIVGGSFGEVYGGSSYAGDPGTYVWALDQANRGGFAGNMQYAVPEPATMSLLGLGLAGLIVRRRAK